jgi:hypothetical protein
LSAALSHHNAAAAIITATLCDGDAYIVFGHAAILFAQHTSCVPRHDPYTSGDELVLTFSVDRAAFAAGALTVRGRVLALSLLWGGKSQ